MNKYYINRHNDFTEDIKSAVRNMNYDIQELSKYCDLLENKIDKAIEYINNTIEDKPLTDFDCGSNNACNDLLNILQNGSDD